MTKKDCCTYCFGTGRVPHFEYDVCSGEVAYTICGECKGLGFVKSKGKCGVCGVDINFKCECEVEDGNNY